MAFAPSPDAQRIAENRGTGWEPLFLAQTLSDRLEAFQDERERHRVGIALGIGARVPPRESLQWVSDRLHDLLRLVGSVQAVFQHFAPAAFGDDSSPADPSRIDAMSAHLAAIYTSTLGWAQVIRMAHMEPPLSSLLPSLAAFSDALLVPIETYPARLRTEVAQAIAAPPDSPTEVHIVLSISSPDLTQFNAELEKCARALGGPA